MQVYTTSPLSYLPLAPISLFCLYCSLETSHTLALLVLTAIFSVGIQE